MNLAASTFPSPRQVMYPFHFCPLKKFKASSTNETQEHTILFVRYKKGQRHGQWNNSQGWNVMIIGEWFRAKLEFVLLTELQGIIVTPPSPNRKICCLVRFELKYCITWTYFGLCIFGIPKTETKKLQESILMWNWPQIHLVCIFSSGFIHSGEVIDENPKKDTYPWRGWEEELAYLPSRGCYDF